MSDVKNIWDLCRNKKNTSIDDFYYCYSTRLIWCQPPTASIDQHNHNHGRSQQKCPPSAPHEALRSTQTCRMDGRQPPEQADVIFAAVEGVYGPQNTPMLWWCIIAGTKEHFEGCKHPQPPPKNTSATYGGCHPSIRSVGFWFIVEEDLWRVHVKLLKVLRFSTENWKLRTLGVNLEEPIVTCGITVQHQA